MPLDFLRLFKTVIPCHLDRPFIGWHKTCDNAHGGGFPRPIRPQKSEDFPFFNFKRHILNGRMMTISFRNVLNSNHCWLIRKFSMYIHVGIGSQAETMHGTGRNRIILARKILSQGRPRQEDITKIGMIGDTGCTS